MLDYGSKTKLDLKIFRLGHGIIVMQDIVWIVVGVRECRFVGIIDEADVAKAATNTTVVFFRVVSRSKPVPAVDRRIGPRFTKGSIGHEIPVRRSRRDD